MADPLSPAAGYDAYLFDLDGTLVDTAPDIMAGLNVTLTEYGHGAVDEARTRDWVGRGVGPLIRLALRHHGQPEPPEDVTDAMIERFRDYYARHIADRGGPYPGVREALDGLHGRAALGVVTNKPGRLTGLLLDALDLSRYFGVVVAGDTLPVAKPAPDPAFRACEALGVDAGRALFVGDSATDVACARAAGCDVICVSYGYRAGARAEDLGADRVVDSLTALI